MLHALAILAAETAKPDKTPFYIAGGLLAAWAVTLSAIGLNRPEFPEHQRAQRSVMAISVVLVASAMIAAVASS